MKTLRWTLFLLLLSPLGWSQQPASPQSPAAEKAAALLQVLSSDQFFRAGVASALQKNVEKGMNTQAQMDCIMASDFGFVRDAYVETLQASLTSEELDEALTFFRSSAGQLTLDAAWTMARNTFPGLEGGPEPRAPREPTPEEQQLLQRYVASPVSGKISAATEKPQADMIASGMDRMIGECGRQP